MKTSGMNLNNKICAFPWVHMSANQQGEMIICCNTYNKSPIKNNNGKIWKLKDISDPLDYFNSEHYKKIRLEMIKGNEPQYCKKCYDIERNGGRSIRQNSLDENNINRLLEITDIDTGEIKELSLNYVHFMWGNKCNLKCKMCDPNSSDQLLKEFSAMGLKQYDVEKIKTFNINWGFEQNRIILEKISPYIRIFNVTGGEPLINNDFLEYCYFLSDSGYSKEISLAFHTNLTVLPSKFLKVWKNFKNITVRVSIDAIEKDYEYIRYPGKWSVVDNNISQLVDVAKEISNLGIEFHSVFSAFNAHAIPDLIRYINNVKSNNCLNFPNTLLVTSPQYADVRCLPETVKQNIKNECLEIINNLTNVNNIRVHHYINNLKSNIKFMLSENLDNSKFIEFNNAQDIFRTIKTEEIINWYHKN